MCRVSSVCLIAGLAAVLLQGASSKLAAASSGSNVLVVYAANSPESVDVANDYAAKRSVPPANLCPVTLPDPAAVQLGAADYEDAVKTPVRACLEAVGKRDILYIVLAYVRPYGVDPGGGLRNYSLDSYLADIWDEYTKQNFNPQPVSSHRYFADNQAQGNFYFPFLPLPEFRQDERTPAIYSVWRLDGSTPEIAKTLVNNAIYAETHGLFGQACIDELISPLPFADTGLRSGDWDLYRAAQFLRLTGMYVSEDQLDTEIGNEPSATTCQDAAFYSGWYSLNTYYDVFTWSAGAVGFHLDSGSALDPRGGANWSANALNRGVTVTSGAMAEPYLEGLPRPSGVFRNLLEGATAGEAFLRNTRWLKWRILNIGDPLYRPFPNGLPPFNAFFAENAMYLGGRNVVVGSEFNAAVTIDQPPPEDGLLVKLSSTDPNAVSVPASVTVPRNYLYALFPIKTGPVSEPAVVQISADTGATTMTNTIVVYPVLAALRTAVPSVTGGQPLAVLVGLNRLAPEGGFTISFSSDHPEIVKMPQSITVPAGINQMIFQVETAPVSADATVKMTASLDGAAISATITVKP